MENKTWGIGIIGAGLIADFHAQAVQAIPDAYLAGVFNRNPEKARVLADRYQSRAFRELDALADAPDIDLVCICTASGAHLEPALRCIRAGKHCLIEKPMEITPERCDRILEAADKAGVKVGVIFPSRFHDVNIRIKEALLGNRMGEPVIGNAYVKWHRSEAYYQSAAWRGTWALDGGGALMNQGIHSVDLLQWFMGPVVSVHAFAANRAHRQIEVEDSLVASVRFANGALGTIECSTAVFPGAFKRLEVLGTEGSAVAEENALRVWQFRHEIPEDEHIRRELAEGQLSQGGVSDPAAISYRGHQLQIEDMLNAIATGRAPAVDGQEGKKSVVLVSAIYESVRTGQVVHLP